MNKTKQEQEQLYLPVPINMLAGEAAAALDPVWNGVATELGKDSICTRTGRCSRRDSVKNLA